MSLDPNDSAAPAPGSSVPTLRRNLERVMGRIEMAASSAGVQAPELVAVTKTVAPDIAASLRGLMPEPGHLGENRADALARKVDAFQEAQVDARWHLIGSIQRNKARRIIERAHVLHAIDSVRLAETVVRITAELNRPLETFIEINLTGEEEKHGLLPDELDRVIEVLAASDHTRLRGLMAMGPVRGVRTTDEVFAEVAALARSLEGSFGGAFDGGRCRLSMGMSGDLEEAIRHGSDLVRVGSALFQDLPAGSPPRVAGPSEDTSQNTSPPASTQPTSTRPGHSS